jgi:hypothetical protein
MLICTQQSSETISCGQTLSVSFNSTLGLLIVVVDMNKGNVTWPSVANLCGPVGYCSATGNASMPCDCNAQYPQLYNGSLSVCQDLCRNYGGQTHVECPIGGCYGVSFRLTNDPRSTTPVNALASPQLWTTQRTLNAVNNSNGGSDECSNTPARTTTTGRKPSFFIDLRLLLLHLLFSANNNTSSQSMRFQLS